MPDSSSRVGWVEQDKEKRKNQAQPSLAQYADKESFWELLDAMQAIATETGTCVCEACLVLVVNKPSSLHGAMVVR